MTEDSYFLSHHKNSNLASWFDRQESSNTTGVECRLLVFLSLWRVLRLYISTIGKPVQNKGDVHHLSL
jgi:hypothetical protein